MDRILALDLKGTMAVTTYVTRKPTSTEGCSDTRATYIRNDPLCNRGEAQFILEKAISEGKVDEAGSYVVASPIRTCLLAWFFEVKYGTVIRLVVT